MITVDAEVVAADLKAYLQKVGEGETVVIAVDHQPVAELRAPGAVTEVDAGPRPIGLCAGQFRVPDDFDDPLPDDVLAGFLGK